MEVVGAIIKNERNEFLLQQRDANVPSFQHCWTLFGGRIEDGETPDEALFRELTEELSFDQTAMDSVTLREKVVDSGGVVQYVYEITTNVRLDELVLTEGEAMAYVPESSLFDLTFAFNIREVLENYLNKDR